MLALRIYRVIYVSHSTFSSSSSFSFKNSSLTRLDLRGNRLSHVSRDVFGGLVRLRFLDLSDNPLVIPRADAERLRHLTAVVKVIITSTTDVDRVPHQKVNPS